MARQCHTTSHISGPSSGAATSGPSLVPGANLSKGTYSLWFYISPSCTFTSGIDFITRQNTAGWTSTAIYIKKIIETYTLEVYIYGSSSVKFQVNDFNDFKGNWHNLITTFDVISEQIQITLYLDGMQVVSQSTIGAHNHNLIEDKISLGNFEGWLVGFDGKISEFGMWNRILNSTEIQNLAIDRYTPRLIDSGLVVAMRILGIDNPELDTKSNYTGTVYDDDYTSLATYMSPQNNPPGIVTFIPGTDIIGKYQNTIQGIWQFNESLEDTIGTNDFVSLEGDTATYHRYTKFDLMQGKLIGKYGLKFEDNKKWTCGNTISFKNIDNQYGLTVGFWWYSPRTVGLIRHVNSRQLTNKIAPILAKSESVINNGIESPNNPEWIISEIGYSDTENAIQLSVFGSTTPYITYIYQSNPYEPGWHHVFVTFQHKGYDLIIKIAIDGKSNGYYTNEYKQTMPSETASRIWLNNIGSGPVVYKTTQTGAIISDLVLRSGIDTDPDDSIKMMRYGWQYITESDLYYQQFRFAGFSYKQESTVNTSCMFTEGDNLLVARSDGTILKGERPLWDVDYVFNNLDDIDLFLPQNKEGVNIINDSQLRVDATSIRIP